MTNHLYQPRQVSLRQYDILRPGYERVKNLGSREEQLVALEREGVLVSLENLMSFPFVREAVEGETMSIHGLWNDIGDGSLLYFDPEHADWRPVE